MKISVIIPVYNTEKYLKECVESVLAQTYHNLEILLINDGATDSSPQICESYAKQDARIKLIHKENGGLSDTRNTGIKQCSGDYVLFLDSDDYWDDPKMVEKLADQMQQYPVDILNFRYKKYMEDTKQFVPCLKSVEDIKQQEKDQILERLINEGLYISSACNKLISASFLKKNELYFEKGKYNEDEFWTYQAVERAEKIVQIEDVGYYYFFREDSIINETYNIRRLDALEARYQRMKYLEKYPEIYGVAKRQLVFNCIYHYQKGLRFLSGSDLKTLKSKVKAIYKDISIDKNDIKEYTKKEKIWFSISKISLDLVCRIRNKFGYGVE